MDGRSLAKSVSIPVRRMVRELGFDLVRHRSEGSEAQTAPPSDLSPEDIALWNQVQPFTLTSVERTAALCNAIRYVVQRGIAGDIVECGVWRGGSMMAAALTLLREGVTSRELWLFDTFEGMSPPTDQDVTYLGDSATAEMDLRGGVWCKASLEDVMSNMASTGYDPRHTRFIKGRVEDSIPSQIPDKIAVLRLDTDWYESTRHELVHLFPRLVPGGVLIIDDYGHWKGSRRATDEYFRDLPHPPMLFRVDYTGRICLNV